MGWVWNRPGDGTTVIANSPLRTVAEAAARGVLWVNAAGNEARAGWSGPFFDRDSDGRLEFTAGRLERNAVRVRDASLIILQLRWQDRWGGARTDLDLYLSDTSGTTVARAVDQQSGSASDIPLELLLFSPVGGGEATRTYFIRVEHFAGPAPAWVQVEAFTGHDLRLSQPGQSIGNPAESASPGVLAVGAANWRNTTALEPFSSRGPTRDGRVKPDIVGADRGNSSVFGPWRGTSQVSPHVAGLAALLFQQQRNLTPVQLADRLKQAARRRGVKPNNLWGYGFAWLLSP